MHRLFYFTAAVIAFVLFIMLFEWSYIVVGGAIIFFFIALGIYDVIQKRHAVLRNFPILGHFRYMFEFIRPEIQQYFIASNESGRPFNRQTRSLVYQRAKSELETLPFGTQRDIDEPGYMSIRHSLHPVVVQDSEARITVGGADCKKPYNASRLNISAMSYGALSKNAVMALNAGAKIGNFAHNTGEGGLSPFHLSGGGDIIWQIGTAYFGCRTKDGNFDADKFQEKAQLDVVKMIEIKLSQGAKPSHGGILPAVKVDEEVAEIRGIEAHKTCISPPAHTTFTTPKGLLDYVARCRELSGGKPTGFKLCIGVRSEFLGICKAMLATKILPDFITVDGAEGGTGAAPVEFSDYFGEPGNEALIFVHNVLVACGLRDKIRIIASGKVATGFDMITKIALGADMCNAARSMMFALGCIQSLQCNANTCPTGVTTQNPRLVRGLVVSDKSVRVANFHDATVRSFLELLGAMGKYHCSDLNPFDIFRRVDFDHAVSYGDVYEMAEPGILLTDRIPERFEKVWQQASADRF